MFSRNISGREYCVTLLRQILTTEILKDIVYFVFKFRMQKILNETINFETIKSFQKWRYLEFMTQYIEIS